MTTYTGTQDVEPGLYFNLKRYRMKSVETRGPLPGTDKETYCRVPMLVMLASAPLLGLAFVIFLPLIGFAMVAWLLGQKVVQATAGAATEAIRVVRPSWAPSLAFLSRSKPADPAKTEQAAAEPDAWTEDVEKKLNENDHRAS